MPEGLGHPRGGAAQGDPVRAHSRASALGSGSRRLVLLVSLMEKMTQEIARQR